MAADLARELTETMRKCDQIREQMQELRDQLAETEAGAAALRKRLEDAIGVLEIISNSPGWYSLPFSARVPVPACIALGRAELASDIGRATLERIRELEEENESLKAHITYFEGELSEYEEWRAKRVS